MPPSFTSKHRDVPPTQLPEAGPESIYCTLYHRDPGFVALAEAELSALSGGHAVEAGVWLSPVSIHWAGCGYGIDGGRQLAFGATLDELAEQLLALRIVAPHFRIETRRLPRGQRGASAARRCIGDCIEGGVSSDDSRLRLLLIVSPLGYRVLLQSVPAPGESDWLRAKHKPHNYLVALPARIAKAVLNLSVRPGDTVLDPFCGSGTIPLLAAWGGHRAFGSDISVGCVARAGENLAFFGLEATLVCVDARATEQDADCIVTNLPYGLYSHFAPDARRDILRNLRRRASRITLITSERIEDELRAEGYDVMQIIPVESERFERFVYLTHAPPSEWPPVPHPFAGSESKTTAVDHHDVTVGESGAPSVEVKHVTE